MKEEEFVTMPLAKRIAWLHGESGPRGEMSHDKLAELLGTSRQVVIGWEHGTEPSTRFRVRLSDFSGFRPEAFSRRAAEEIASASLGRLLGQLSEVVDEQGKETQRALRSLTRAIERLERRLGDAAPGRSAAGGRG